MKILDVFDNNRLAFVESLIDYFKILAVTLILNSY